jgi:murein DD-endopeptidase MepM/ murein hydrolase activator NlpD
VETLATANRIPSTDQLHVGQRLFIPLPRESGQFLWPTRGALRTATTSRGVAIAAQAGSLVRASRSGRVAVATHRLSGWGRTIVIDHLDGYLSIYCGFEQILVAPGTYVRQGLPIGNLGSRALHFEIRHGNVPKNTLALLPQE